MGSSPIIKNPGKGEFALLGVIGVLLAAGYFYKDEVKEKVEEAEEKVEELAKKKKRKHKRRDYQY